MHKSICTTFLSLFIAVAAVGLANAQDASAPAPKKHAGKIHASKKLKHHRKHKGEHKKHEMQTSAPEVENTATAPEGSTGTTGKD